MGYWGIILNSAHKIKPAVLIAAKQNDSEAELFRRICRNLQMCSRIAASFPQIWGIQIKEELLGLLDYGKVNFLNVFWIDLCADSFYKAMIYKESKQMYSF